MKIISEKVNIFTSTMEDMENILGRNNVRVVGLPERTEGSNPMGFMEKWFTKIFGKESFSPFFAIERAYRIPYRMPAPGGQPRPFLVKLLFFSRKRILYYRSQEK